MHTSGIQWIGHSARFYRGQPDTHFGWYRKDDGEAIIVKRLNPDASPHAQLLTEQERQIHLAMQQCSLAVPALYPSAPDELHTHFSGYSLKWLMEQEQPLLSQAELLTVFTHLCMRASAICKKGFLNLDISSANIVLPLEHGMEGGRLLLDQPMFIDCCNTIVHSGNACRPLWLRASMVQIAPEVGALLEEDQLKLARYFAAHGLLMKTPADMTPTEFEATRQLYASYNEPQILQDACDKSMISADAATQYALGVALQELLDNAPSDLAIGRPLLIEEVISTTQSEAPENRYPSLDHLARLLEDYVANHSPLSQQTLPAIEMEKLIHCVAPGSEPPDYHSADTSPQGTIPPNRCYTEPLSLRVATHEPGTVRPAYRAVLTGIFLLTVFMVAGWKHAEDPEAELARIEQAQLQQLQKKLQNDPANYECHIREVALKAQNPQSPNMARGARRILEDEANSVRLKIAATNTRASLAVRLAQGDPSALQDWQRIKPKIQSLAASGHPDATRWLKRCEQALKQNPPKTQTIRNLALLH